MSVDVPEISVDERTGGTVPYESVRLDAEDMENKRASIIEGEREESIVRGKSFLRWPVYMREEHISYTYGCVSSRQKDAFFISLAFSLWSLPCGSC